MVVTTDPTILRGIAEFYENEMGEAIIARTESLATFRELGPPDLCHVNKTNPKALLKDIGSYHYVLGVDASSSATLAAYLNSLTYCLGAGNAKTPTPWKIRSGTYCCFNAFSRVDVRVEVRIPGGVESYVVDLRGDKHQITNPAIWQEAFVSAVLRAILDDNDEPDGNDGNPLLGLRKLDPLPTLAVEKRFLEAAAAEFWKGWQLGTEPEVQIATYFSNHLINGIMKYFSDAARMNQAATFLEPLFEKDPEVAAPLARAYIGDFDEIKAVKTLYDALKRHPLSYGVLLVQIQFLKDKGKLDMAVKLAKLAVTVAPSEYVTWEKLTEIYIEMGDYESALLALNSCPMFTYCEKDSQRMPPPMRTHLPLKPELQGKDKDADPKTLRSHEGTIFDENDPRESEVHPELQRLPALSLRGTFARAYALLIKIVGKVGWDELLRFRSSVFVMEEEYRIHRAIVEEDKGKAKEEGEAAEEGEKAKVEAEVSASSTDVKGKAPVMPSDSHAGFESVALDENTDSTSTQEAGSGKTGLSIDELLKKSAAGASASSPEKKQAPVDFQEGEVIVTSEDKMGSVDGVRTKTMTPNPRPKKAPGMTFRNKRLCEKWLDNLFMVLYNDLRLYTALKQEMSQYKSSDSSGPYKQLLYRKTGAEWEIYGDLSLRLGHPDDATTAYKLSLEQRFSTNSWMKLMFMASASEHVGSDATNSIREALTAAVKLATVLDRAYVETVFPSPISRSIFELIRRHGHQKVHNVLISMNVPSKSYRLITRYFEYAEVFRTTGVDW